MTLPIASYKTAIIDAVRNHYVTIVTAETGSGKSTQIPQYLSEYFSQVVVTEPRIMAAKTLAKRVSEEMNVTLGEEVGYRTGYDKCDSTNSKILYCTDGLQLVRTIFNHESHAENVLIIDEVHEWNLNIETLIAWCKFMYGKWNTKVVIMSATLDAVKLSNFFGNDSTILSIPGNLYDVTIEERSKYELIETIKENIHDGKNILVFVAGKKEINDVIQELTDENATVLPLHGEMDWEEQKKCFEQYPNPKVVVATNVAQTSLTIPDIDVVVDTGEARISIAENGIQGLFLKDISCSDIMQRKGRAGRTKEGKYFLCSNTPIKYRSEDSIPEIQRSILDRVVLQMAEIGLKAEELEFYHQPDMDAILQAKKELTAIGAIQDDKVTNLGHKIVKMPVSVQLARMIIEAEKYGVTEQVITIAAIIEMGGLLDKEGRYFQFSFERKSDLLAELDVWNSISKMGYIDFDELGIRKKNFFRIKQHIQKLKETLYGIVKIENNDNREAVVKSCLYGLVSHIYVANGYYNFCDIEGNTIQLDRKSCVSEYSKLVIGIPKEIEIKNRYGFVNVLRFLTFATEIDVNTLMEIAPDSIEEATKLRYSKTEDAVEVTIQKVFAGIVVATEIHYNYSHPEYARLKAEYEKEQELYNKQTNRQEVIKIGDKIFQLEYSYFDEKTLVCLDDRTLFTTGIKEAFLDSGEKVYFYSHRIYGRRETNIVALRNAVENSRIKQLREEIKYEYEAVKVNSLSDAIANRQKIGQVELTMNNGGYGDTPIYVYGCLWLKKNTVMLKIADDKEIAESNTLEALQHLFYKEIEKRFGDSKFSHQKGKKKKVLTESEMNAKMDFYSLVREVMLDLTLENAMENLEFLEEYYQELMN